jgi:hypothetical protein
MLRLLVLSTAALAMMLGPAAAQSRVKAGTLTCNVSGGTGLIVASNKQLRCTFSPVEGRRRERYVGVIRKFGLDVGSTSGGQLVWAVYAPTTARRGALAGTYVGATAEATVGAGLGANALIGGSGRTVALQPVSVQGQAGLNVAAGVADLELRAAR